jgi:N utilization substance protein B
MPRPLDSIARELALQYLYCRDVWKGEEGGFDKFAEGFPTAKRTAGRAKSITGTVIDRRDDIDSVISRTAENWPLHRMSIVCRNILRIGAAELMFRSDVPFKVVIDEAVELAKRYDAETSGAFVNGILDKVAREFRTAEVASNGVTATGKSAEGG